MNRRTLVFVDGEMNVSILLLHSSKLKFRVTSSNFNHLDTTNWLKSQSTQEYNKFTGIINSTILDCVSSWVTYMMTYVHILFKWVQKHGTFLEVALDLPEPCDSYEPIVKNFFQISLNLETLQP